MAAELPRTRLLSDAPAEVDSTQLHSKVAGAIARLILTGSESGKAIALSGSWGSGKSTVVKLVEKEFATQSRNRPIIFLFDAWAHQDDPVRRSFLEAFLDFIIVDKLIASPCAAIEDWKLELDLITGRREKSTTTTRKELTPLGSWVAGLMLFALPLGLASLTKFSTKKGDEATLPFLVIGLVLIALPLLIILIARSWQWKASQGGFTKILTGQQAKIHPENIMHLLLRETSETKTSETEKAANPTAKQFRDLFGKMVKSILHGYPGKKLLVVVDNLDRIDAQQAVSIWATMRIFFELCDPEGHDWPNRLWLLAPFDPSALRRLWASDKTGADPDALAESFINKTFQVVFRVSPPVLSRWRDFFEQQFKEAFLDEPVHAEWQTVYRLYDRYIDAPTLREIKLFLNKLSVLYLQWYDKISLPYLALYILVAREMDKDPLAIVKNEKFLRPGVQELLPGASEPVEWQQRLAAVHYNVLPVDAMHVLVEGPLTLALSNGDNDELQKLEAYPGFWLACERMIEVRLSDWVASGGLLLKTLHLLETRSTSTLPVARGVLGRLADGASRINTWPPVDEELANAVLKAHALLPDAGKTRLQKNLLQLAITLPDNPTAPWLNGVLLLMRGLSLNPIHSLRWRAQSTRQVIECELLLFKEGHPHLTECLHGAEDVEIPVALAELFQDTDVYLQLVRSSFSRYANAPWIRFVEVLSEPPPTVAKLHAIYEILPANRWNEDLIERFQLRSVFAQSSLAADYQLAALTILPIYCLGARVITVFLESEVQELSKELLALIRRYNLGSTLLRATKNDELSIAMLRQAVLAGGVSDVISTAAFVDSLPELVPLPSDLYCDIVEELNRNGELTALVVSSQFDTKHATLYRKLLDRGESPDLIRKAASVLLDNLELLSDQTASSDLADLALAVIDRVGTGWIPAERASSLLKKWEDTDATGATA